ncbi:Imm3 family immunity protein [Brevibacillus brevis]|uniref:Imm3 family immunity protein n=1 Tax=Brevibacillus brevis TaxID=1393 RepID=UPI00165E14F7|nr:Imm3 family immunity protein [Brevibacillus brevis]
MRRNYEALFGAFYERYFDFKSEKMSDAEALVCTSDAYFGVQRRGEMEKAVVNIAEGRIYLTHSKIFFKAKEKIVEALSSLDLQKLQLETSPDEYQDILERRDMVLDGIDNIPIDYSPYTRWYYYEMEKEVRNYFGVIINDIKNVSELVDNLMERFERDCTNTSSENIVVKTTIAELLIRHGIKENEQFVKIKSELEQFDINDVGEQLTEDEKADLSIRIKEVLSK